MIIFIISVDVLPAQQNPSLTLQRNVNLPHPGDSLVKQQVDYIDPGSAGYNITWDFRAVNPVNDHYNLIYHPVSHDSTRFSGIEHGTNYHYLVQGDSLIHTGYENSTTIMKYSIAELKLKFPFRYGYTISSDFNGEGEYCQLIPLKVSGRTTTTADATGILHTPLGLTFKNVLRVKSQREYLITGLDSTTMILENYAWYVSRNRYPVFETVKTTTKISGRPEIEHKVVSFFYPPADQVYLLADTSNWSKQYPGDESDDFDDILSACQIIPNPVRALFRFEYEITRTATISFRLSDRNGLIRHIIPESVRSSGHYSETIDMTRFSPGSYILTIIADKRIKALRVIKI